MVGKLILSGIFLIILGCSTKVEAQQNSNSMVNFSLKEIALLSVLPTSSTIDLEVKGPAGAGSAIVLPQLNGSSWLNYTSAIALGSPKRVVTAQVDNIIPGLSVALQACDANATGKGVLGSSTGKVLLGTLPVNIVTGIGGAFTGYGVNNGHALQLNLEITDYAKLTRINKEVITITYTISN